MPTITAELKGEPVADYAQLSAALKQVKSLMKETAPKRGSGPRRSTRSRATSKPGRTRVEDLGELAKDDVLEVEGKDGRYKFRRIDDRGIHVWGGPAGREQSHTFALDRPVYRA